MGAPLETDHLVPNATFLVELAVVTLVGLALVVWPLLDSLARRQWGWVLFVLLTGPVGGAFWLLQGRRQTASA